MQDGDRSDEEWIEDAPPEALLQLPTGWLNLLADGDDARAARDRYQEIVEQFFPGMGEFDKRRVVDSLVAWREMIWGAGMLAHGFLAAPPEERSSATLWQILVTLVKVPQMSAELDAGAVLSRVLTTSFDDVVHEELFETALGYGAGLVGKIKVPAHLRQAGSTNEASGTAVAISCPRGGGWGILVAGMAYDHSQAAELGFLVGQIAGHSTLLPRGDGREEKGRSPVPPQRAASG